MRKPFIFILILSLIGGNIGAAEKNKAIDPPKEDAEIIENLEILEEWEIIQDTQLLEDYETIKDMEVPESKGESNEEIKN